MTDNTERKTYPTWPYYDEAQINAVQEVLSSGKVNYWTGEACRLFEQDYAEHLGLKHAVAVANGTVALELALRALGIGSGDKVMVPCRSFVASASTILQVGAEPVFADIHPESQNICLDTIKDAMVPGVKAIIVVHLNGWPCDMDPIMDYAKAHDLKVIEDCAQAHGASYKGRVVGSIGDIAAFSFCQDKIISTGGEGGMVATHDEHYWRRMWSLKDHGKNYDKVMNKSKDNGFKYVHDELGGNLRMTEMQAVLGRYQLKHLDGTIRKRRANAHALKKAFSKLQHVTIPMPDDDIHHAYYKFYILLDLDGLKPGWDRARILANLHAKGVPCLMGICADIRGEKLFDSMDKPVFKHAKDLGERCIAFNVHPTLREQDLKSIAQDTIRVLQDASDIV